MSTNLIQSINYAMQQVFELPWSLWDKNDIREKFNEMIASIIKGKNQASLDIASRDYRYDMTIQKNSKTQLHIQTIQNLFTAAARFVENEEACSETYFYISSPKHGSPVFFVSEKALKLRCPRLLEEAKNGLILLDGMSDEALAEIAEFLETGKENFSNCNEIQVFAEKYQCKPLLSVLHKEAYQIVADVNRAIHQYLSLPWREKAVITQNFNEFMMAIMIPHRDEATIKTKGEAMKAAEEEELRAIDPEELKKATNILHPTLEHFKGNKAAMTSRYYFLSGSEPDSQVFFISETILKDQCPQLATMAEKGKIIIPGISNGALAEIAEYFQKDKQDFSRKYLSEILIFAEKYNYQTLKTSIDQSIKNSVFLCSADNDFPVLKSNLEKHSSLLARNLSSETKTIVFTEYSSAALSEIARFFTTGSMDFARDTLLEITRFAKQWECLALKEACLKQIEEIINNRQALEYDEQAVKDIFAIITSLQEDPELKTALLYMWAENPRWKMLAVSERTLDELEAWDMVLLSKKLDPFVKLKREESAYKITLDDVTHDALHRLREIFLYGYMATHLNITCNDPALAERLGRLLREYGKKCGLQKVELSTNNPQVLQILSRTIVDHSSVSELTVQLNGTALEGLQGLGVSLAGSRSLQNLQMIQKGDRQALNPEIVEALLKSNSLQKLALNNFSLSLEGSIALAKTLEKNMDLKELNLEKTELGSEGISNLALGLARNQGLTTLNLSETGASTINMHELGQALEINTRLQKIDLSLNDINDTGPLFLMEHLSKNKTLQTLDLRKTKITAASLQKFPNSVRVLI
jgi:hypothetical protein